MTGLPVATTEALSAEHRTRRFQTIRHLSHHTGAMLGMVVFAVLIALAIFAPMIAPFDPIKISPPDRTQAPSLTHLFGTDNLGRDVFSRVLYGARVSLWVGVIAVVVGLVPGVVIGVVSGFYGGAVDIAGMRLIDVMLTFPRILLALTIVYVLGASLTNVIIAVGIASIPAYARIVRASVLSAREHVYVEAARVVGCRDHTIMFRHILPNVIAPVIVVATLEVAAAIISAAGLSFLGMGIQPPNAEWGSMLSDGRSYLRQAWWISTFPGLAIMLAVLAINLVGDGMRDVLDVRLRGS